ncbi:MAG TPA: carbon-nitrogen hydrolase family protein [Jatrophihabitantaceae bacterium]|jgi:predicted amidohydrolase|nr:carbon-nitrogen hydrolase family protein [Jatrophihabitantaceae bacterium]
MRVALCQIQSSDSPAENLSVIRDQVQHAVERDARLVVFPEATMARFGTSLGRLAEPLDGPWASAVTAIAVEHAITVVAGMFTPADDGRVHNTLLVTGPDGVVGYDKIHLYDAFGFRESDTVSPGRDPVVVSIGSTRVGLATCYDVRFPELFVDLAQHGATVIVVPASWGSGRGKAEQWELLVRARALDSVSWIVAAGQAYPPASGLEWGDGPYGIGHSMVAAPDGTVAAVLGAAPDQLIVDVNAETALTLRTTIPVLDNRVYSASAPVG